MSQRYPWNRLEIVEDVTKSVPQSVKSAARALRVIEFFDEIRRGARTNEIAERLQIPQSSASILLNSLKNLGYLDFDTKSKTYLPSIRTAVLSTWRDTGYFRDGSMLDLLEELSKETVLAAGLVVRQGIYARYLVVIQPSGDSGLHIPLSVRRYAVKMAGGIVLVAKLPDKEVRQLWHLTRAEQSADAEGFSRDEIMQRVTFARENGYFLSDGLVHPLNGGIGIALPESITGGWQDMALTFSGRRRDILANQSSLIEKLVAGIAQLAPGFSLPTAH